MSPTLDSTHDPQLRSWVDSANLPGCDFPIQNLPLAVFRRAGSRESFRCGAAIGDSVLDLGALGRLTPLGGLGAEALAACGEPSLHGLMALGRDAWTALRRGLSQCLREGSPRAAGLAAALIPRSEAEFTLPVRIGDYTDFYTSIHHATAIGRLFRPDQPLLPNYKWVPIAYHGRASSLGVSGQEVRRPRGQIMPRGADRPQLAASARLDFELEVGVLMGSGNRLGEPIPIAQAEEHVFGLCLLNDWSARDLQAWEYQPLGPFLAKSFASTISPWVVTLEALAPYRLPWSRPAEDPQPLPYLDCPQLRAAGALDMHLEVALETATMREAGAAAQPLARTNFRHSYWSIAQMVAHHTVNGCNLEPGDLLGTGTQSGPTPEQAGSLLELTEGGKRPIALAGGETRIFLEDGDRVILRGWCERPGCARIGFGEASGTVLAAPAAHSM
ncbi:MAG TPA: fumarylacetoacetase [Steroidobacteraceae bacterium]|nr:fumarylacetoacetase [Steroidobacteraceae bacterium]